MQNKHSHGFVKTCIGATFCAGLLALSMPLVSAAELVDTEVRTVSGVNKVNNVVSYAFTFDPEADLDNGDTVEFTFPADFDISGATIAAATNTGAQLTSASGVVAGNTITATLVASGSFTDDTTITIAGVETPNVAGFYPVTLETPDDTAELMLNVSLDATVVANPATVTSTADYSFTINGLPALDGGDIIYLTFPDGTAVPLSNFDITGMSNPGITGQDTGSIVAIVDAVSENRVVLTLDGGATILAGGSLTVTMEDIINPTGAGVHGIGVEVHHDGAPVAQGIANAAIGNAVEITALVREALLMTLDSNIISLNVDPSAKNHPDWEAGQDKSQSTLIEVSSNSPTGYTLRARMDDGQGNARLIDSLGNQILSNSYTGATNSDNYFGYSAVNTNVASQDDAYHGFVNADTTLYEGATTASTIGSATMTDPSLGSGGQHAVNYDLNVSFLTPAGLYTSAIYYTVVASF